MGEHYEASTCLYGAPANVLFSISPSKLLKTVGDKFTYLYTSPFNLNLIFPRPLFHFFCATPNLTVLTCHLSKKMRRFVSRLADGPLAKSAGIPHGQMFCLDTARPEKGCALLSRASFDAHLDGLGLVSRQSPSLGFFVF